jgi:hypothetical protein
MIYSFCKIAEHPLNCQRKAKKDAEKIEKAANSGASITHTPRLLLPTIQTAAMPTAQTVSAEPTITVPLHICEEQHPFYGYALPFLLGLEFSNCSTFDSQIYRFLGIIECPATCAPPTVPPTQRYKVAFFQHTDAPYTRRYVPLFLEGRAFEMWDELPLFSATPSQTPRAGKVTTMIRFRFAGRVTVTLDEEPGANGVASFRITYT